MFDPERGHGPEIEPTEEKREGPQLTSQELEEFGTLTQDMRNIAEKMGATLRETNAEPLSTKQWEDIESQMGTEKMRRYEELGDKTDTFLRAFGIDALVRLRREGRQGQEQVEFTGDIIQGGKWLLVDNPNEAMQKLIREKFAQNIKSDIDFEGEKKIVLKDVTAKDIQDAIEERSKL